MKTKDEALRELAQEIKANGIDHPDERLSKFSLIWAIDIHSILDQFSDEPKWQPIDTAPMDGTDVDLWVQYPPEFDPPERIANCQFQKPDAGYGRHPCWVEFEWFPVIGTPTHWMPVPTPPEDQP